MKKRNNHCYIYFQTHLKLISNQKSVQEVRAYIQSVTGFKDVVIIEQLENLGLAKSIISGVTMLCEKNEQAIVLEDDLETSPYFLKYMNDSLVFYEGTPEVIHISGCRYPVEAFGTDDTFFLHVPLCWGWATWKRAWCKFDKHISLMERFDRPMVKHFDFDGSYTFWG